MTEVFEPTQSSRTFRLISAGVDTSIQLQDSGVFVSGETEFYSDMKPGQLSLLSVLLNHMDTSLSSTSIRSHSGGALENIDIARMFKKTVATFGSHDVGKHFVTFDRGRSTKYACLEDSSDPSILAENGRADIRSNPDLRARARQRRLRAVDRFEEYYDKSSDTIFATKKLVGLVATGAITVGGIAYIAYSKHRVAD